MAANYPSRFTYCARDKGPHQAERHNDDDISGQVTLIKAVACRQLDGDALAETKQLTGVASPSQPESGADQLIPPRLQQVTQTIYIGNPHSLMGQWSGEDAKN
jgi:hypothetical protein